MEEESAVLSSREREAVAQAEVLKQELEERGSKVPLRYFCTLAAVIC